LNYKNNISPEELETIERYLTGQMPGEEAVRFEEQLNTDALLQAKTAEVTALLTGISEESLGGKLNDFHKEISATNHQPARVVSFGRKLLVAASILAVAFVSVWFFTGRKTGEEAVYAKLYSPDPGLATVMGNATAYEFDKAMVEYKNGDYDKALEAWTSLLQNNPANDTLIYFVGAAYQARDDTKSIEFLEKVAADSSSVFYKDANWYLGLFYLKTAQKAKAIEHIERSGHPKTAEAINAINKN